MRVALRSGMVEIQDARLARDLRERNPVSGAQNQAVRIVVSKACDVIVRESGMSVFAFDKLIWHLGRSCCFYDHDPICGPGRAAAGRAIAEVDAIDEALQIADDAEEAAAVAVAGAATAGAAPVSQ